MFKKLLASYSESFLKKFYEKMCKVFEPILEGGSDFENLVKEIPRAWVTLKDDVEG
jgi:hypothetical protein